MNRARKRQIEKQLKSRLTDVQFEQLKAAVIEQSVEERVTRIWETMSGELIRIMRAHHISEERVSAICMEFHDVMLKKFGEGKEHEGLSQCGREKPDNGADGHTPNDGKCKA